ncbi:MAG: hypothetical protein DMF34_05055 [Verrucomicrobia bacterium]|nr:MAG: hypothetical protein DMF34_05055 [Verrucomicrobiota bacterium]
MHRGDPFKSCNQFDVASHSANQARRSLIDSKMSAMTPLRCLAFLAPTTSGNFGRADSCAGLLFVAKVHRLVLSGAAGADQSIPG